MADEPGAERPDDLEEEEGGPVKSFLEHLEDLRWVLIKGVVAVALGMILCLIGANFVLTILKWPLERADKYRKSPGQSVTFLMGTNVFATVHPGTNHVGDLGLSNAAHVAFEFVPRLVDSNYVLTLQPITNETVIRTIASPGTLLRTLSPVGGFWVAFQVALYGGIVIASPYLIYVIGGFILPALKYNSER